MTRALLVLVLVACGAPAKQTKPPAPSIDVRTEIAEAEKQEKARRHDLAKIHYEKAIAGAKDPASVGYANSLYAETLATWGEYPLAIRHLETAVAARPFDPQAWHNLGVLKHNAGDHAAAIKAFETARDQAPSNPKPRIALAALRWKLGDKPGATAEYRKLLELELSDRLRDKVEWALQQLAKP